MSASKSQTQSIDDSSQHIASDLTATTTENQMPETHSSSSSSQKHFLERSLEFRSVIIMQKPIVDEVETALLSNPTTLSTSFLNDELSRALYAVQSVLRVYSNYIVAFEHGLGSIDQVSFTCLEHARFRFLVYAWKGASEFYHNVYIIMEMMKEVREVTQENEITWEECVRVMTDIEDTIKYWWKAMGITGDCDWMDI